VPARPVELPAFDDVVTYLDRLVVDRMAQSRKNLG
jgi:hypothetical protein